MKECPECSKKIPNNAEKCRYCGSQFITPQEDEGQDSEEQGQPPFAKLICNLSVWLGTIIFAIVAFCLFFQGKILAGFSGIVFAAIFFVVAPFAWKLGDLFRKFATPDLYFADGAVDLALKKLFWMIGPQFSAVGIVFIFMMAVLLGGIAGYR
jgi:hypothetical protein